MNDYERVHPPEDSDVIARFPQRGVMALYESGVDEPFIAGYYVDLDRAR